MITIEKSLYDYYKREGIYLPETELIIIPDHKNKRGLVEFNPLTHTKRRKTFWENEKKRIDNIDLGYNKGKGGEKENDSD